MAKEANEWSSLKNPRRQNPCRGELGTKVSLLTWRVVPERGGGGLRNTSTDR